MTISITSAVIRYDGRTNGKSGEVIADFHYADGQHERCRFTAADGQDAMAFLQSLIPGREAGRVEAERARNMQEALARGAEAELKPGASSVEEIIKAVSDALPELTRERAVMAKDFLASRTDDELAAALKTTKGDVTDLRSEKLTAAAALADSIRASKGA